MPRVYKRRTLPRFQPQDVRHALKLIRDGLSVQGAAEATGISWRTLMRYKKSKTVPDIPGYVTANTVFTPSEEVQLREYLETSSSMFYGLSTTETRQLAFQFAARLGKKMPKNWIETSMAGIDWLRSFLRRNRLSIRTPEATSINRAQGFNRKAVNEFYINLAKLLQDQRYKPGRVINLDETGFTNVHACRKIVAPTGRKQVGQVTAGERGELITAVGIITDNGNTVPPVFVFPRKRISVDRLLHGSPPGSVGANSGSGWMTADIFAEIVLPHIVKALKPTEEDPVLIIADNHASHISLDAINFCRNNHIAFLTIPPHCSNKLQPLDVAVYGPFKRAFNTALQDWMSRHAGTRATLYDLCAIFSTAYDSSFTRHNIVAGFKATGVSPFNRNIFNEDDFLPADVHRPLVVGETSNGPTTSETVVTPEVVRPLPRLRVTETKKARPKGASIIATSTPEKLKLESKAVGMGRSRNTQSRAQSSNGEYYTCM